MHEEGTFSNMNSNTEIESKSSILNIQNKITHINGMSVPKRISMCIPLMSDNIYEKGDAWRIWSCIYLAYRLKNTMDLLPKQCDRFATRWESPSFDNYKYSGGMVQRGKYLTRRKDKFWWRAIRKAYCPLTNAAMSTEGK